MQPLRDFGQPLFDASGETTWIEAQQFFDEDYPAEELRYYRKSLNLPERIDAAIERIVEGALAQPSPLSTTDVWHLGGAIHRADDSASTFVGRHESFLFNVEASWADPGDDESNMTWARQFVEAMQGVSDGSRQFNFPGLEEEGDAIIRNTYGAKYERLAALKNKYDPANLFRPNSNIKPSLLRGGGSPLRRDQGKGLPGLADPAGLCFAAWHL